MPKVFSEQGQEVIRDKLLNAGIQKLTRKRCRDITVDEIAGEVGIAKGTFYNSPSKEPFSMRSCIPSRNGTERE